jgi:chlorite dismutase
MKSLEKWQIDQISTLSRSRIFIFVISMATFLRLWFRWFRRIYEQVALYEVMKRLELIIERAQNSYVSKAILETSDEECKSLSNALLIDTKQIREMLEKLETQHLLTLADRYSVARKPEWYLKPEHQQEQIYLSEHWGIHQGIKLTEAAKTNIRNEVRQKRIEFFVKVIVPILGLIVALLAIFYKK